MYGVVFAFRNLSVVTFGESNYRFDSSSTRMSIEKRFEDENVKILE